MALFGFGKKKDEEKKLDDFTIFCFIVIFSAYADGMKI